MNKMSDSRRKFLKKAIYKTPTLFVLGSIGSSVVLYADVSGGPPGPPGGFKFHKTTKQRKLRF